MQDTDELEFEFESILKTIHYFNNSDLPIYTVSILFKWLGDPFKHTRWYRTLSMNSCHSVSILFTKSNPTVRLPHFLRRKCIRRDSFCFSVRQEYAQTTCILSRCRECDIDTSLGLNMCTLRYMLNDCILGFRACLLHIIYLWTRYEQCLAMQIATNKGDRNTMLPFWAQPA